MLVHAGMCVCACACVCVCAGMCPGKDACLQVAVHTHVSACKSMHKHSCSRKKTPKKGGSSSVTGFRLSLCAHISTCKGLGAHCVSHHSAAGCHPQGWPQCWLYYRDSTAFAGPEQASCAGPGECCSGACVHCCCFAALGLCGCDGNPVCTAVCFTALELCVLLLLHHSWTV